MIILSTHYAGPAPLGSAWTTTRERDPDARRSRRHGAAPQSAPDLLRDAHNVKVGELNGGLWQRELAKGLLDGLREGRERIDLWHAVALRKNGERWRTAEHVAACTR